MAGTALALLSHVLLARLLGVADFGLFAYALAWLDLLAMIGLGGLDSAALRFVPEYDTRQQGALLRGFLRTSARFAIIAGVVLGLALVVRPHGLQSLMKLAGFSESLA